MIYKKNYIIVEYFFNKNYAFIFFVMPIGLNVSSKPFYFRFDISLHFDSFQTVLSIVQK